MKRSMALEWRARRWSWRPARAARRTRQARRWASPRPKAPDEARVHKLVEPRMGSNVKVDAVSKTGYGGLYEVRSGGDIFYTDANARYMFVGKVVDLGTLQDLTRARADELAAIRFADLPLEMAIKTVKGNGQRVMAVFEDPNCPYCRKLHETLRQDRQRDCLHLPADRSCRTIRRPRRRTSGARPTVRRPGSSGCWTQAGRRRAGRLPGAQRTGAGAGPQAARPGHADDLFRRRFAQRQRIRRGDAGSALARGASVIRQPTAVVPAQAGITNVIPAQAGIHHRHPGAGRDPGFVLEVKPGPRPSPG